LIEQITEWLLIIYFEIATFIITIVLSTILWRKIRQLPLSSMYVPLLFVAFGFWLLGVGVWKKEGAVGVAGLALLMFWVKKCKFISELKELEPILREYIEELGEAWFKEVLYVLRDHLKKIRGE